MAREMDFVDECYADKDLSLLKKLTLVIPTYNRNYYLSRCLWYHAHFPFGQIIVADSSPEEKKVVNRETVAKVREMFGADILYLEYKPETEKYGGDIYRKWGDAVMHVETEYSQICTDKEFVIPTTILSGIIFLEDNLNYIATQGYEYGILERTWEDGGHTILFNRHPTRHSEEADDAMERILHSFKTCNGFANSILLSLMRTTIIKEIYNIYYTSSCTHDLRYGEVFLAFGGYLIGKVYHNESLVSRIRDEIGIYIDIHKRKGNQYCKSRESSTSRYPSYEDYVKLGLRDQYYNSIKMSFHELFNRYTEYSPEEIHKYCNILEPYLKTVLRKKRTRLEIIWDKVNPLYYILPLNVRIFIKQIIKSTMGKNIRISKDDINISEINRVEYAPEAEIVMKTIFNTMSYRSEDRVIKYIELSSN